MEEYPDLGREAIAVEESGGWKIKLKTVVLGIVPIGPRLARGTGLPDIPKEAGSRLEAMQLAQRWNAWLQSFPNQKVRKKITRR
jgi:hypothetical protein